MRPMSQVFDVIVLGVGGFGSSVLFHLASRGLRVLGVDQFGIAHDRGSSHGETRIIRKAYFEHPDYVPLLLRAYDLWAELETESQRQLFWPCGLMLAGLPNSEAISGARRSAEEHNLEIDNLTAVDAQRRWAGFQIPEPFDVVFEREAGFLKVEECVHAHLDRAMECGASLHLNDAVVSWSATDREVRVRTEREEFVAAKLVITAGAWAAQVLADLKLPLQVLRKPFFWHATTSPHHELAAGMPTYYFEMPTADRSSHRSFYGFPSLDGRALKVAEHTGGDIVDDPLKLDRKIRENDAEPIREFLKTCLPGTLPVAVRDSVCMYTVTPDRNFVIDRHPDWPNVVIGCGFSGHGFKFTTVLGQALADLAMSGRTDLPIAFLNLARMIHPPRGANSLLKNVGQVFNLPEIFGIRAG